MLLTLRSVAPASPRNLNGVGGVRTLQLTWEVPSQGVFDSFRVSLTNAFENIEMSYAVPKNGDEIAYSFSQMGLVGGVNYFVKVYSVTLTEDSKDSASHLYYTCECLWLWIYWIFDVLLIFFFNGLFALMLQ